MKQNKKTLTERMKGHEVINKKYLIPKLDTIIRLDGKAFHTYTKQFKRPFDDTFIDAMNKTAQYLCESIQGAKFAYVQSDEISIYISDQDSYEQQKWYNGNVQKIVSVAASLATAKFNRIMFLHNFRNLSVTMDKFAQEDYLNKLELAQFDARVFQLPNHQETINCLIWRQQDATRNSISAIGQYHFSDKELFKKSTKDIQKMLIDKNDPWEDYDLGKRNGRFIQKNMYINDILVGETNTDMTDTIWYQPDNNSTFYPSKHGRALQYTENTDGDMDWCDIDIKKIRSCWEYNGALKFIDNKYIFSKYFIA